MMSETHPRKTFAVVAVACLVAGLAVTALAPVAAAAKCYAYNGSAGAGSEGSQSCAADCNWFGCNAQARDFQNGP